MPCRGAMQGWDAGVACRRGVFAQAARGVLHGVCRGGLGCVQERGVNTGEGWDAKKRDVHRRGMGCAQEKKVHGGFERNVVETRHGE